MLSRVETQKKQTSLGFFPKRNENPKKVYKKWTNDKRETNEEKEENREYKSNSRLCGRKKIGNVK